MIVKIVYTLNSKIDHKYFLGINLINKLIRSSHKIVFNLNKHLNLYRKILPISIKLIILQLIKICIFREKIEQNKKNSNKYNKRFKPKRRNVKSWNYREDDLKLKEKELLKREEINLSMR